MIAVEFNEPGTGRPDATFTNRVRESALEKGLILLTCGVYGNVVRFLAPLTIQENVFEEALNILEVTLRECSQGA
jgi:4-aminobutyrate aminotransferase